MPGPQIFLGTKVADFLPKIVKFSPIFYPKLGEDQKKKQKNRSSLKFSLIFDQKSDEGQTKKT